MDFELVDFTVQSKFEQLVEQIEEFLLAGPGENQVQKLRWSRICPDESRTEASSRLSGLSGTQNAHLLVRNSLFLPLKHKHAVFSLKTPYLSPLHRYTGFQDLFLVDYRELDANLVISALSVAMLNSGCAFPGLVLVSDESFFGLQVTPDSETRIQTTSLPFIPDAYAQLMPLLDIFKSRVDVALRTSLN
jgi:hypothetical protein